MALADPCLYVGAAGAGQALVVERPWADIAKTLSLPLHRHRYGS